MLERVLVAARSQVIVRSVLESMPALDDATLRHVTGSHGFVIVSNLLRGQQTPGPLFTSSLSVILQRYDLRYKSYPECFLSHTIMATLNGVFRCADHGLAALPDRHTGLSQ